MSSSTLGATSGPGAGYRHEAYFYRGPAGFLDCTLPFIQQAMDAHEPILVALAEPRLQLVRDAIGAQSRGAAFVDMAAMGRNPARLIPVWLEFLSRAGSGGRPVRGIGEPMGAAGTDEQLAEWQFHEALLNTAVHAATDFWLRCPYDRETLHASVITEAQRSHPRVADHVEGVNSDHFAGHTETVTSIFGINLPPAPGDAEVVVFDGDRLWRIRQEVAARMSVAGAGEGRIADVVLAVHELATNSVRHGNGVGRFRAWRRGDTLMFEIADSGVITDPLVGRIPPPLDQNGGRGVWLVNQLCDLVQIRSGQHGTTVRITVTVD